MDGVVFTTHSFRDHLQETGGTIVRTPEADERLRLAVIGGKSLAEISGTLGRSVPAVKARAYKLGLGLRVIGTSRRALAKWG